MTVRSELPRDPAGCPCLVATTQWDEAAHLRGEIHTAERLSEHAVEVARAHGRPSLAVPPGRLRQRFHEARARIEEAYDVLSRSLKAQREPSPAEEWLLDNSHIVEDQIREVQEDLPWGYLVQLPRLASGKMCGYPRVYGLCLDYLRHTDGRIDMPTLARYVLAYQTVHALTIGELWAIPIMLRIGLVLATSALAASEADARDRDRGEAWAARILEHGRTPQDVAGTLTRLERVDPPVTAALLVELLRHLREHEAPLATTLDWVKAHCARMGVTPEELTRRHHLRQAADQVSVGNSITSMRAIGALDWNAFFERTSRVEHVLRRDPAGAYADMDVPTRDRYRHAVERLARRCELEESAVAQAALDLARRARDEVEADGSTAAHVGYWLVGDGRRRLERRVRYRAPLEEWVVRPFVRRPSPFYFGAIVLMTAAACVIADALVRPLVSPALATVLVLLFALPASEIALAVVNAIVVAIVPPRVLPKMSFEAGLPPECRTLVVVPALLDRPATVAALLESLEIRSLANLDENLHFALLTDFCDADDARVPQDDALLALAREGVERLNQRWSRPDAHRYVLLHRRRVHDAKHRRWMGWERKRGKLEELNRLLRGRGPTTFDVVTAPAELLARVRYVLTLDADTDLPRDTARKLAAALAHPLNRPRVSRRRVVQGHGVIQPRVGTLPTSARRTRYARAGAAPTGIDPYTTAVSDVYQDLFDQGSYVGKGIYDVDAFLAALDGRVPEGRLLSHDLFEGIFARSALATDIEVLDEQPSSYEVDAARAHRWIRGDWQMLPWLLRVAPGGRDLGLLDSWKIFDNLRRSVIEPALVALCVVGWLTRPAVAAFATGTIAVMFLVPVFTRAAISATQARNPKAFVGAVGDDVMANARASFLHTVFLLDRAFVSLDAVFRTLFRLVVSRRRLLEWTTMSQAERDGGARFHPRILTSAVAAVVVVGGVALRAPGALPFALPVLGLWIAAPVVASYLRLPEARAEIQLSSAERKHLRLIARRTWRFFDTFVTANEHHLPPDNYQEDPRGVIAHRTSPTNIGLYLLSIAAARDFGFLPMRELVERYDRTFSAIERLERREGHVLNWYDTTTLRPLEPQYVSTVDNGNLAAYLWTVREACEELARAPLVLPQLFEAADDALVLAAEIEARAEIAALRDRLGHARESVTGILASDVPTLREAADALADARDAAWARLGPTELRYWVERAAALLGGVLDEVNALAPHPEYVGGARSIAELATLDGRPLAPVSELDRADVARGRAAAGALLRALGRVGARAAAIADGMSFTFLFDDAQKLFSIGYNASTARRDGSHYDLLASEARLASLVAIAKGEAPQEHWFRMGRPRAAVGSPAERVLLSWSGSMFEYLMPLLVMKTYGGTLLDETYQSAIRRQIDYGAEHGVPWGISESAFNLMDLAMTYQYRGFGVPGLGLKAGLGEDLVVAPYATALAAQLRPRVAAANFRALEHMKALGIYGFYDALDCTRAHLPPGRTSVVVKTFMAHHQGMTLVALDNALHGAPMQDRFHRDPRVKATELLLEERVPTRAPLVELHASALRTPVLSEPELDVVEHVGLGPHGVGRLHLLGHGDLSTAVTVDGQGFTTWKGIDVYRFREDTTLEAGGIYLYVRDRESGRVWSAGLQPTKTAPDFYDVQLAIDHVEIVRRDGDLEAATEIVVSPERPAEVRRVTLTNHGTVARELDVTTYTEVVLAPRAADVAHRAFGGMFVETEAFPERSALLAHRRPRAATEEDVWLTQVLWTEGDAWEPGLDWDTSRATLVGRGRTTEDPAAMHGRLAQTSGAVLDPALAMRRSLRLPPGGHARVTLTTGLASSREDALELVERFATPHILPRAFELAWADARVELKHLGVSAAQSHRFQRLLSAVVFPRTPLRGEIDRSVFHGRGRAGLWAHGLSSDLPIVVLQVDDPDFSDLFEELLLAHEFFRVNGVPLDLVAINEEAPGYMQPQQEALLSLVRASPAAGRLDQRGGVFLRRAQDMSDEDVMLLLADARVVLKASGGSLARQLRRVATEVVPHPRALVAAGPTSPVASPAPERPALRFDNGIGGFADDGREYVALVSRGALPPAPWSNVIAWPHFGTLVTESGASFTWYENSQRHRLTPWSNDPLSDPSGETFFLRDEDDGAAWSPTPLPAGGDLTFRVRHGQGYTVFEHARGRLACELTVFVGRSDCVKAWRFRIRNDGTRARRLSLFGVVEWVLGATRETSRTAVLTAWEPSVPALLAENPLSLHPGRRAFFTASAPIAGATGDRVEVFGAHGSRARPAMLDRAGLSGRASGGLDPCGALQVPVEIAPGETATVAFLLGEGENAEVARTLARRYRDPATVEHELDDAKRGWRRILDAVQVHTPDAAFDTLVNHWLVYQVASCRVWGRSAFYQSGGAYGYRDQLQDVLALLAARPDVAREHLLHAAARQFLEGDVQHWWHACTGEGIRTRCSDDMLWLPYAVAEYVRVTGDAAILDERVAFLKERAIDPEEEDVFSAPAITQEKATLYEHCARALDAGATSGPHGLPKMGAGDWNDGMNRVGRGGKGESVWLAWFLAAVLRDFAAIARARGDVARAEWCALEVERLTKATREHAWDGAWYRRAFFDDGTPLGSHENAECRIDAIAQSWAVLSGVAEESRAREALGACDAELVREGDGLIRLLWPPFREEGPDPGYIRAYPGGVRENGGQYTHGAAWTVRAVARLGAGERANRLFAMLNPIHHGDSPEAIARYAVEPYVVAADVYDAPGRVGRGGWTWYTGSAGWMYRVALEDIVGLRREGALLRVDPCVAKSWTRFEVDYRDGEGTVHVTVDNPDGVERGVARVEVDGAERPDGSIPLTGAPGRREARVVMGGAGRR